MPHYLRGIGRTVLHQAIDDARLVAQLEAMRAQVFIFGRRIP